MSNQGAYTSIEQIRDWFYQNALPLWVLYSAIDDSITTLNRHRQLENTSVRDLDDSWELLERNLRASSAYGGEFTIRVDNHLKFKHSRTARLRLLPPHSQQAPGQYGQIPGHAIAGMGSQMPSVQEQIQKEVELAMLKRDNEDLESALEEARNGDGIQGLINRVLTPDNLPKILSLFRGKSVSLAGFDLGPTAADEGSHDTQVSAEDQQGMEDQITAAFTRIATVFPDVPAFLDKLSQWIENNPDVARQMFDQI